MQCWRWTAVWGVCQIIVAYKKEKGLLTPQSTDAAQEVDRGLMCIVRGTNSEMFSPCCETWIQLKESENFWAKWCIITKTQNLKMKELVSAAAVSFRHARAQVFSFCPFFFLSVFTWIRLMMNSYPYFVQITTPAQEVHFDFWCHSLVFDVAYSLWSCWQFWFKLSHVPYDDFCSICFWFLLSQKVESIFVHLFCPEHALFAPHQSCHKPVLFYAVHP